MGEKNTKEIVRYSMLMALTIVATILIKIPSPATKGYLNLGDTIVLLSGLLLGKKAGFLIGGIGSAIADILLGYTYYAPITLIVKGIEGFIAGYLMEKNFFKNKEFLITLIGGFIMAVGYYIFQIPLYGSKAALLSMPGNLVQGLIGAIGAIGLYKSLIKLNYFNFKE